MSTTIDPNNSDHQAIIRRAWEAIGIDPVVASDDPETADLADSITVSLRYERDKVTQAQEEIERLKAENARQHLELGRLIHEMEQNSVEAENDKQTLRSRANQTTVTMLNGERGDRANFKAYFDNAISALQTALPYVRGAGCYFGERDACLAHSGTERCGACAAAHTVEWVIEHPVSAEAIKTRGELLSVCLAARKLRTVMKSNGWAVSPAGPDLDAALEKVSILIDAEDDDLVRELLDNQ